MRAALTAPGYIASLTRDEGKLFLLRATMLGSFYPNLLRGALWTWHAFMRHACCSSSSLLLLRFTTLLPFFLACMHNLYEQARAGSGA